MGTGASRSPQRYGASAGQPRGMSRPGSPRGGGGFPGQSGQRLPGMGQRASPVPFGSSPMYPPPSPPLQNYLGQSPYSLQNPSSFSGARGTDYVAVANIAGMNPTDVALLHREYMSLTGGGRGKIDRVVFRQLLREAFIEANSENIDRAIENIFIGIDRNRDGFIDFPEFIGAFRDFLNGGSHNQNSFSSQNTSYNASYQGNSGMHNIFSQPITYTQQPQTMGQNTQIPYVECAQPPIVYNGPGPLVIPADFGQLPY